MEIPPSLLATCEHNRGPMLSAVSWSLLSVAIVIVFIRMAFRLGRNAVRWWDDYVMAFSLVFAIIGVAFLTKMIQAGVGQHIYCLREEDIPVALKWSIWAQIMNNIGIGLVKVSVCLFVLRVIDRTRKALSRFLWLLIAFVILSHTAQVILFVVQCRPMAAIWDKTIDAQCFSSHITYLAGYVGFGLDALTDLTCAIIPVLIITPLQINTRTKVALTLLTSLGVLTAGCAIAKAVTLSAVFSKDYTYQIVNPAICTILEHLVGMVLACAPCLRPIFKRALNLRGASVDGPSTFSSSKSGRPILTCGTSASSTPGLAKPYRHRRDAHGRFSPSARPTSMSAAHPSNWRRALILEKRQSRQDPLRIRVGSQTSIPLYEGEIRKTTQLRISTETAMQHSRNGSEGSLGDRDDWGLSGEEEMKEVGLAVGGWGGRVGSKRRDEEWIGSRGGRKGVEGWI